MILVDRDIMLARGAGDIVIEPYDEECLGTNSYDVHLAPTLRVYVPTFDHNFKEVPLSVSERRATQDILIPPEGYLLQPGELYLASTVEYTESHKYVPMLNGKSSIGRYGLSIHVTAGTGDVGFCNHWTMELFVVKPLLVKAGMAIGQLLWFDASSEPIMTYAQKPTAKYRERSSLPMPSEMAANFDKPR